MKRNAVLFIVSQTMTMIFKLKVVIKESCSRATHDLRDNSFTKQDRYVIQTCIFY